ncbi:NAD-dependent epimerase/dehydratase family protein [Parabacteroides sp.]
MIRFLITGGSGFIGTHLISFLSNMKDTTVLNIDTNVPKLEEHKSIWKNVDICDKRELTQIITEYQPDKIIHLAARTDLNGKSLNDYKANIEGVNNLLDALEQVPTLQQAIFTSSMYVCYPGYKPRDFEDYAPHTLYGESKVLTEEIIKKRNPSHYTWSIIRPTSIWGPYFGEPYDKFFKIVLSHSYFHMGKRACKKTYGYIDNTIYQINSIIEANKDIVNRKVFYIGDYEPYDITEWSNEIASIAGIKIPQIPYFLFYIAGKFGDLLKKVGITFPMTSFRLRNMTTNNIHNLQPIQKIAPLLPVKRKDGSKVTIEWIRNNK